MATTATRKSTAAKRAEAAASMRERRRSNRIPNVTAGIVGNVHVQVFDVSLHGVGFRTTHAFEVGEEHPVVIGNGPMYLEGRLQVVSVRPRKDGVLDVGCVFV